MGVLDRIAGRPVYLDTMIFIYALEGYPATLDIVRELFRALDQGELTAVTSELTLAECLVKPMIDGSVERQAAYERILTEAAHLRVVPITRHLLVEAARQRAAHGIRLPDAIHVATARSTGCEVLVTNDRRLRGKAELEILVVEESGVL